MINQQCYLSKNNMERKKVNQFIMRQQINKKEILKLLKLKEADDSKKGKLFIPRNIDKKKYYLCITKTK
jgi:hypothetical protein